MLLTCLFVLVSVTECLNWEASNITYPYPVIGLVYGILNGTLFTFGGNIGINDYPVQYIYQWTYNNPNNWNLLNVTTPLYEFNCYGSHCAVIIDEYIYIFGADNDAMNGSIYIFNTVNKQFENNINIPSMQHPVYDPCVTIDEHNNIYLIGGRRPYGQDSSYLQILDVYNNSWKSHIPSIPSGYDGVYGGSCMNYGDDIFYFYGIDIYKYSIKQNEWEILNTSLLYQYSSGRGIWGSDGSFYLISGFYSNMTQKFDPKTKSIVAAGALSSRRYTAIAFTLNDQCFVGCGANDSLTDLDTFEVAFC